LSWGLGLFTTFEEFLAKVLWRFGPVVTIGQPGERLPPSGASREYMGAEDDWQTEIKRRAAVAGMIVAVVGKTEGLVWEIQALARLGALPRFMLVLPPRPPSELDARWQGLRWLVYENDDEQQGSSERDALRLQLPADLDFNKTLVLTYTEGDWPTVITSRSRTKWDYEEALAQAARLITTRPASGKASSSLACSSTCNEARNMVRSKTCRWQA
jgi:hypothetical protein